MAKTQPSVIVVGVDGSTAGRDALSFAMREATLRGSAVEVVTTWQERMTYDPRFREDAASVRLRAEKAQEGAISAELGRAAEAPPVISRHVVEGEAGPTLVHLARTADYLVVGSSTKGPVRRAVLGSAAGYCVDHASCPVVVVRPRELGMDGADTAAHADLAEPA